MIVSRVRETIGRFSLFQKGDRILVAVSGGLDSVCLLHILWRMRKELGIELAVCHFNHRLRDTASRDEKFVAELSDALALPFYCGSGDVISVARERGLGIEDAARHARYSFFERLVRERGFSRVALAHTLSDNVETFFVRVIKGAGLEGLKGIPPKRGIYVRPLIEVTRDELENYAKKEGLSFVEDESNRDVRFLRNWVRIKLIPFLREVNPSIEKTVGRILHSLRDDWEIVREIVERAMREISFEFRDGRLEIDLDSLCKVSLPVRKHLVLDLLYRYFYPTRTEDVSLAHVEAVVDMSERRDGSERVMLPEGIEVLREYSRLKIGRPLELVKYRELIIPSAGTYLFGGFLFVVRKGDATGLVPDGRWCAVFDASRVEFPLILRYRKPGDRLFVPGVGRKKLQDFFVDLKVPKSERDAVPLLVNAKGEVLWIVGYRQREDLLPHNGEAIIVEVRRVENEGSYRRGEDKKKGR